MNKQLVLCRVVECQKHGNRQLREPLPETQGPDQKMCNMYLSHQSERNAKERSQQHVRAIGTYISLMCDPERHYCGGAMWVVSATLAATRNHKLVFQNCIHSEDNDYPAVNCAIHKPGVVKND